jgi:hypothetical protein
MDSSLLEGVNLLVSSGTASAIAVDRLSMVKRKTARYIEPKASLVRLLMGCLHNLTAIGENCVVQHLMSNETKKIGFILIFVLRVERQI